MSLPSIARVRRRYQQPVVADVVAATAAAIRESRLATRLAPGSRVAITAGSRGICRIGPIAGAQPRAVRVARLRSLRGRRDGKPRRRHRGRSKPHCSPSWVSPKPQSGCPIRSEHGDRRAREPTRSACRSISTATPTRPTASSFSTGSSRTPRSPGGTRAGCSRCSRSVWASARGPLRCTSWACPGCAS